MWIPVLAALVALQFFAAAAASADASKDKSKSVHREKSHRSSAKSGSSRRAHRLSHIDIPEPKITIRLHGSKSKKGAPNSSAPSSPMTTAERFDAIRKHLGEQKSGNPQNFFSSQSLPTKSERNALLVRIIALPYLFEAITRGIQFEKPANSTENEHVRVDFSLQTTIFGRIFHSSVCTMKKRLPHRIRAVLYQVQSDVSTRPDRLQYELVGRPQLPAVKRKHSLGLKGKRKPLPAAIQKYFQEHEAHVPWIITVANCFLGLQLTDFAKQVYADMESVVTATGLQNHKEWAVATAYLKQRVNVTHGRLYRDIMEAIAEKPHAQREETQPGHFRHAVKWISFREDAGAARTNFSVSTTAFADIEKLID